MRVDKKCIRRNIEYHDGGRFSGEVCCEMFQVLQCKYSYYLGSSSLAKLAWHFCVCFLADRGRLRNTNSSKWSFSFYEASRSTLTAIANVLIGLRGNTAADSDMFGAGCAVKSHLPVIGFTKSSWPWHFCRRCSLTETRSIDAVHVLRLEIKSPTSSML